MADLTITLSTFPGSSDRYPKFYSAKTNPIASFYFCTYRNISIFNPVLNRFFNKPVKNSKNTVCLRAIGYIIHTSVYDVVKRSWSLRERYRSFHKLISTFLLIKILCPRWRMLVVADKRAKLSGTKLSARSRAFKWLADNRVPMLLVSLLNSAACIFKRDTRCMPPL